MWMTSHSNTNVKTSVKVSSSNKNVILLYTKENFFYTCSFRLPSSTNPCKINDT